MVHSKSSQENNSKAKHSVLLVEDSLDCQILVKAALENEAVVTVATDVSAASQLLKSRNYELLLLDVNLPDGNGFDFFSELNMNRGVGGPRVIFLTANDKIQDKLTGFSIGADDYVVKPFNPMELRARALAHIRHREEMMESAQTITVGRLRLNLALGKVDVIGENGVCEIEVTPVELKLLGLLAKNVGRIMLREQLALLFNHGDSKSGDRVVDVYMSKLRRKLTSFGYGIESIYGFGYRLTQSSLS